MAVGRFVARRCRSIGHAAHGLALLVRGEVHGRLHLVATLLAVLAGVAVRLRFAEWRWIILACALVWSAEAFNTALERLCDRVCAAPDPAIGAAKDLAAGAVLVAALAALAIGATLFLPYCTGAPR